MNSYNDNLHSAVTSSLASQELDIKNVQSQAIASMFTLFHAEAATVTAEETLESDTKILTDKTTVNNAAVTNSNISTNLLASATQADTYVKQSVTNTAVGASNVQIATNAIVRLAADMGSIYSIVHAADYQSDIYNLTVQARDQINQTAYLAEVASDLSMEASILTAEVSSGTVLSKAKLSNTSLQNLLATTTAEFNNASAQVAADTVNVGTISIAEQAAEGTFEDLSMDYRSTWAAYNSTQRELNLNLRTSAIEASKENIALYNGEDNIDSMRKVKFKLLRSAFPKYKAPQTKPSLAATVQDDDWTFYPVEKYYLMLVKDTRKSTFTIANAEAIIRDNKERAIEVPVEVIEMYENVIRVLNGVKILSGSGLKKTLNDLTSSVSGTGYTYWIQPRTMEVDINFMTVNDGKFKDSDGDAVAFGTDYVIFVMAKYEESYKKEINNFDDYLSAPSWKFTLRHQLTQVTGESIGFVRSEDKDNPFGIQFKLTPKPNVQVEYRCMFLPYGPDVPTGLLNNLSMDALMYEVQLVERIAHRYDPTIAKLELELALLNAQYASQTAVEQKKTAEEITKVQTQLNDMIKLRDEQMALAVASHRTTKPREEGDNTISYIFNRMLAEQISPGNYLSVIAPPVTTSVPQTYTANFGLETTDIFGNMLNPSETLQYLVVVLSVYNGEEVNTPAYSNAWSGYEKSPVYPAQVTDSKPSKKK
jgi:hypothetical protein